MSDLYVFTGSGNCRSCDAPLLWFRTPRGKNLPVDDRREVSPGRLLEEGQTMTAEEARERLLPFTHWSTCPQASTHRRPRPRPPAEPTKVYLASSYSRRAEMAGHAAVLREAGLEVTSRWVNGSHELDEAATEDDRARLALEDVEDVARADAIFAFTDGPKSAGKGRGGRHVELGLALALGKRVLLIGPPENVFHYLPQVERCGGLPHAVEAVRAGDVGSEAAERGR